VNEQERLAEQFEPHRGRLRAVAARLLGSAAEADDAVQETWLRLARADARDIENLGGWLTTVVSRVCLDQLRARGSRRAALERAAVASADAGGDVEPEDEAVLVDAVGAARCSSSSTHSVPRSGSRSCSTTCSPSRSTRSRRSSGARR
jgi:RNA polymerase sigma-70 factor (ECF subfamily)